MHRLFMPIITRKKIENKINVNKGTYKIYFENL